VGEGIEKKKEDLAAEVAKTWARTRDLPARPGRWVCARKHRAPPGRQCQVSQSTAGKGPGITFRAGNGSGTVRVSAKSKESQALLEVLGWPAR